MTEQELLQLADKLGFSQVAVVDTEKIPFEPLFRRYCEDNLCGQYGGNYTCPPDCGTTKEMEQRVRAYQRAVVLQSCWEISGTETDKIREAKAVHNRWTRELIQQAGGGGLMVGSSGCNLCHPCLCISGEPCRFPELRFSCMSAYCIHVAKLAEMCGMDYFSEGVVRLFSMYCFGKR